MNRIIDELIDLLHVERKILLSGNVGELSRLLELKTRLFARLELGGVQKAPELSEIARLAKRNLRLLEAAKKGIQSASARFDPTSTDRILTTYGMDGRKQSITPISGGFEHRA